MPKHEPVHKLPYTYESNDPYSRSEIFVVCQSADPKIMGYISHRLTQKDLEYFIHAGNAYPKMVEALKSAWKGLDRAVVWAGIAEDKLAEVSKTLKEIGEAE